LNRVVGAPVGEDVGDEVLDPGRRPAVVVGAGVRQLRDGRAARVVAGVVVGRERADQLVTPVLVEVGEEIAGRGQDRMGVAVDHGGTRAGRGFRELLPRGNDGVNHVRERTFRFSCGPWLGHERLSSVDPGSRITMDREVTQDTRANL
jgi:hypothetical protein